MNFHSEDLPQPRASEEFPSCAISLAFEFEQQVTLNRVIEKIRSCTDLVALFSTTTFEIRQLLRADRVGVFQFTPNSGWDEGKFVAENAKTGIASILTHKVYDHCFGEQFAIHYGEGRIQALADVYDAQLSPCHVQILSQFQVRANLIVPLRLSGNQLWGLLCIHQCQHPRQWQHSDIEFARQIANNLGVALQQALYLQQVKHQAAQLAEMKAQAQAMERQQSLVKIAHKIRRSLDFATICQIATDEARHLLKTDRVTIYQFNPDWSGNFVFESKAEGWDTLVAHLPTLHDTHLMETQGGRYAKNEPFAVADIYQAGHQDCHIQLLEAFQARAYAIAPIFQDQRLWGLLGAYQNSGPRNWQADEVQLLAQIGEQLGIALQQANYVQQIQAQAAELEHTLTELKQSQAKLIQQEKMAGLGQLVAGVAHEINNPVNFISGNLTYVDEYVQDVLSAIKHYRQHYPQPSQQIQQDVEAIDLDFILQDLPRILTSMRLGTDRIQQIVLSLRNFSRLDEADYKAVDVHEGIDSTLLILGQKFKPSCLPQGIQVVKRYGKLPPIQCYPAQLNQVFLNLLTNAIDAVVAAHTPGQETPDTDQTGHHILPCIEICTGLLTPNQIEIRIRDNGIGINDRQQGKIFDYFFTTKPVGSGTGLGLPIAREIIVNKHSGDIQLVSTLGQGTEVVIHLPTAEA